MGALSGKVWPSKGGPPCLGAPGISSDSWIERKADMRIKTKTHIKAGKKKVAKKKAPKK